MKLTLENQRGSVLRVSASIWVPQRKAYATSVVIFDTGAYKTIIDEDLAALLEIPVALIDGVSTVTATGISATHSSIMPKLLLGKMPISDIPVNVMKLPKELKTRCILGMNVLQEFDIHVSSFRKAVTLTPMPLPKKYFREDYSIALTIDESSDIQEKDAATISTENRE